MKAGGQALLCCDAVAHDPSGKTTLYGVFDRIRAGAFPTVHPLLAIYWRCAVPGPGRAHVTILKPDESSLADLDPVESGREGLHTMQGTYVLAGMEFPVEGEYTVVLKHNNAELLRTNLFLEKRA